MKITEAYARLDEAARLEAARGSLVFHVDLATEVARAGFARRGLANDLLATLIDDRGYRVFAFAEAPTPRAIAQASFDDRGDALVQPVSTAPPRAWTLAQARRTILAETRADAAIVVPSTDPRQPIVGHALALSGSADTICLAGHSRLTLDAAGRRIAARVPLDLSVDPAPLAIGGRRTLRLATQTATPVDLHIYLSLKHGVALSIETRGSGLVWQVDGERVSRG